MFYFIERINFKLFGTDTKIFCAVKDCGQEVTGILLANELKRAETTAQVVLDLFSRPEAETAQAVIEASSRKGKKF